MKKVIRTCEEDSKIPKLTAGTLSKRIAKKPTKLEQERIAMLLNRGKKKNERMKWDTKKPKTQKLINTKLPSGLK